MARVRRDNDQRYINRASIPFTDDGKIDSSVLPAGTGGGVGGGSTGTTTIDGGDSTGAAFKSTIDAGDST